MSLSFLSLLILAASVASAAPARSPHILWITLEDLSPELGCFGDRYARTPAIDRFAKQSVLYSRAFSNAGACAPARSTLITGMYPPSIGTHHMRSEGVPPHFVRGFTEELRQAGYYCSNHAKTDYNWKAPDSTWDAVDPNWRETGWSARADRPFFTVINITDTHSSQTYQPTARWAERRAALPADQRHSPAEASVPPFYPDTPQTRTVLARYADNVSFADGLVAEILDQLEADGLADDTIVFLFSDHGTGLPRSKSFLFESSLHVPLLIRFPRKFDPLAPTGPGGRVERLVGFIDFAPTVLSLAGAAIPEHYQGQAFLGPATGFPRRTIHGYRDRIDERYELMRSVRDGRFKYIRNYLPHLPWFHGQTRLNPSTNPLLSAWHRLSRAGELSGGPAVYMALRKPPEQLFDLRNDPHELENLAERPDYGGVLQKMRRAHRDWLFQVRDLGFLPEGEMWRRFRGRAYDAVREDPDAYPLERILDTADLVAKPGAAAEAAKRLSDPDSTVRFWAATALLAAGEQATPHREPLRGALGDVAPDVRAVAAQALCGLDECDAALDLLMADLESDQVYASLRAANAIDHLDERARPLLEKLRRYTAWSDGLEGQQFFRRTPWSHKALRVALRELSATVDGESSGKLD